MSTLILRLAAPMQAWGADSKYNERRTRREPTKSGVIGLLAAALGCRRDDMETLAQLSALRFGVRADREGISLRDFQMAHRWEAGESTLTYRDYLCDAVFLVGLEGDEELLERLCQALRRPVYPLFLGRRSCPPTGRVCMGIEKESLEQVLAVYPWQGDGWRRQTPEHLRVVLDTDHSYAQCRDVPVSFSPFRREFAWRNIREEWITLPQAKKIATDHDPMAEL